MSSFLSEQANYEEIIQKTNIENLDIITSGDVPPNPSELIASSRTDDLLHYLQANYSYIIIDTPPVGIISDALVLMDKADLNIYVARQDFTIKKELVSSIAHLQERNIDNLCLILNAVSVDRHSRYGYGYYEKESR